jgi:HEAT repeats
MVAHRGSSISAGALLAALCLGTVAVAQEAPTIEVRVEDGRLSLRAEAAALAEVLYAIGEAGGFAVVIRGDLAQPVERVIEAEPLEDALQELARGHSMIVKRARDSGDLAEIRVIANPVQSRAAAPVVDIAGEAEQGEARDGGGPISARAAFRQAHLGMPAPTEDDLRFALAADDQAERVAAIPRVGSLHPSDALDVLEDVLAEDEDPLVRSRAVAALTRLDGDHAGALLQAAVLGDADTDVRIQAINALAASPEAPRRTTALARAMRDDPEPDVRRSALLALQRVGGGWARAYLERTAPRLDPELRMLAERALLTWPQ